MENIINIYKPVSLTPLQALEKFKKQNKRFSKEKISYPGRLDPMAEGVLLLLVGEENKKITQYMKLEKEYQAQILFNFQTDTYDILGIPTKHPNKIIQEKLIKKTLKQFKGIYNQTLPPYSSYKIKGKSLFHYARTNQLDKIDLPKKQVEIKNIKINSIYNITNTKLLRQIKQKINNVEGDFRQKEILNQWEKLLKSKEETYQVIDTTISCTSGTYIRAIANDLGKKLNTSAILLNLKRTRVGKYGLKDAKRLK